MKKVSSSTVTDITRKAYGGPREDILPVPTAPELIDALRARLMMPLADPAAVARNARRLKDLDGMIASCPAGFELTPVLYTKVSSDQNNRVQNEYTFKVRKKFFQFLAHNRADDLRALGICDHGIERMKSGLDPARDNGMLYDISVDHIIERSGAGLLSIEKSKDKRRGRDGADTFGVNHLGNLILLPEKIHKYKNDLNTLQGIADVREGQAKWMLMMVPVRNKAFSGYVCPPQTQGGPLAGLHERQQDQTDRLSHTSFVVSQARRDLADMRYDKAAQRIVSRQMKVARASGVSVAVLAHMQASGAVHNPATGKKRFDKNLRHAFNAAIEKDLATKAHVEDVLRPGLAEAQMLLRNTFNALAQDLENRTRNADAHYKSFQSFYHGKNMRVLRVEAAKFPFAEAAAFLKTCDDIDTRMAEITAQQKETRDHNSAVKAQKAKPTPQGPASGPGKKAA